MTTAQSPCRRLSQSVERLRTAVLTRDFATFRGLMEQGLAYLKDRREQVAGRPDVPQPLKRVRRERVKGCMSDVIDRDGFQGQCRHRADGR